MNAYCVQEKHVYVCSIWFSMVWWYPGCAKLLRTCLLILVLELNNKHLHPHRTEVVSIICRPVAVCPHHHTSLRSAAEVGSPIIVVQWTNPGPLVLKLIPWLSKERGSAQPRLLLFFRGDQCRWRRAETSVRDGRSLKKAWRTRMNEKHTVHSQLYDVPSQKKCAYAAYVDLWDTNLNLCPPTTLVVKHGNGQFSI